jgi:hypothetical protein
VIGAVIGTGVGIGLIYVWEIYCKPLIKETIGEQPKPADDGCDKEIEAARRICTEAYANGWESDYNVRPFKSRRKKMEYSGLHEGLDQQALWWELNEKSLGSADQDKQEWPDW